MRVKVGLTIFLLTACVLITGAQTFNRPIPPGLFPYEFSNPGGGDEFVYMITPLKLFIWPANPAYRAPRIYILDSAGYLLWYSQRAFRNISGFQYYPDRHCYTFSVMATLTIPRTYVLDANMQYSDSLVPLGAVEPENDGSSSGIAENHERLCLKIKAVYDLLGRQVSRPQAGCFYIVIYENGKSEVQFFNEWKCQSTY